MTNITKTYFWLGTETSYLNFQCMTIQQTYLLTMERLMEMKSMIINLQSEMESLKNQVDDFTTKWVDTYDVMAMLRVNHRTIDNYINAGKLTATPIGKLNPFTNTQVKGLMYTPTSPNTRFLYDEVQIMMQLLAQIEEAGED